MARVEPQPETFRPPCGSLPAVLAQRTRATIALALAWGAAFGAVACSDAVPYHRDVLETLLPLRAFAREELLSGSLPRWYPYEALGAPFLGQIVTGFWHPATWLLLPLPAVLALKWQTLLAYAFALAGGYRLNRRLGVTRTGSVAGGIAFGLGGYALAMSNNTTYLTAFATLPWVFERALRHARTRSPTHAAQLSVVTALVFLAGDAQGFALSPLLFLAAIAIEKPRVHALAPFALAGALALLLVAIELVPATELGAESVRRGARAPEMWALAPVRLLEFVHPAFVPESDAQRLGVELLGDAPYAWATTLFAGAIAIVLALSGLLRPTRAKVVLAALGALAIALASGRHLGVLALAERLVPALQLFRFPEKFVAFAWVAFSPLVGLGWDGVGTGRHVFTFGAIGIAALAAFAPGSSDGYLQSAAFVALAGLALHFARRAPSFALAVPVLLAVELVVATHPHLRTVSRAVIEEPLESARVVRSAAPENGPPPRVFHTRTNDFAAQSQAREAFVRAQRRVLQADAAGLEHVPAFGTRLPGLTRRARLLLGPGVEPDTALAPFLNGCFDVADLAAPPQQGAVQVDSDRGIALVRHPCRPRAFLSGSVPVPSPEEALRVLASGVGGDDVVWEGGPRLVSKRADVRWIHWEPSEFEIETATSSAAALVVHDQFVRGWSAEVDGRPAEIRATTVVGLGVEVPPGIHRVRFTYRTPGLGFGIALSTLGLAGVALAIALTRRNQGRASFPAAPSPSDR